MSNNLRLLRLMRKVSQHELGVATNVAQCDISLLERDLMRNVPETIEKRKRVAQFFGVPVEEIFPDIES